MWTVGVHYAVYSLYILYLFNCTDDGPLKKNCVHNLHTTFSITCDNCIQLCPVASAFHSFGTFNFRKYYFFLVSRRDVKTCVVLYIYLQRDAADRGDFWRATFYVFTSRGTRDIIYCVRFALRIHTRAQKWFPSSLFVFQTTCVRKTIRHKRLKFSVGMRQAAHQRGTNASRGNSLTPSRWRSSVVCIVS